MNRTKEIELLKNPGFHTMKHNGYIIGACCIGENVVIVKFNKEYFN